MANKTALPGRDGIGRFSRFRFFSKHLPFRMSCRRSSPGWTPKQPWVLRG